MEGTVIDIKVEVVDGSFHEVDSNELAFRMAGIFALKDAFKKAGPILLEPIMKVECDTPDEYQGDLLGDINRRRGTIVSIEAKNGNTLLNAGKCRWPKCSVMPQRFVRCRKAAPPIPWSR